MPNKKGGSRPGAGRKSLYAQPLTKVTLRLSIDQIISLSNIDPNLSNAVRMVLDQPQTQETITNLIQEKQNAN